MIPRREWAALALILLVYLPLAALYAIRTPAWQAPDEPAHYNYVAQLADGRLPVLEAGDWQQDALDALRATGFDPALHDELQRWSTRITSRPCITRSRLRCTSPRTAT